MSILKKYQPSKNNCKVTFSYPAMEGVENVKLLGDFNNWDPSKASILKKSKTEFTTQIELNAGATYEFRYLVNDNRWDNDFRADKYVSAPFAGVENSVIILDHISETTKTAAKKATNPKTETKALTTKTATKKAIAKPAVMAETTQPAAAAKTTKAVKAVKTTTTSKTATPSARSKKVNVIAEKKK